MKLLKALLSRPSLTSFAVLIELFIAFSLFHWFTGVAPWIEVVLRILSALIVLLLLKNSRHLSVDMFWILMILLAPVGGTAIYLLLAANLFSSKTFRAIVKSTEEAETLYVQDENVFSELAASAPVDKGQFNYLSRSAGFPFYRNTGFDYYPLGDVGFPVMLEELKKAEKFIFLEYFIVEEGVMWNRIVDILEQKAAQGVDVRVMYDDLGSFFTLSASYAKKLEAKGISCISFNRISLVLSIIMNHRDHRKIMVIDGRVAFSGGINLADEYINAKVKYGHWKDNVIRVTGDAVWSYTVMFLTHWNALRKTDSDFSVFRTEALPGEPDGFICPYGETPLTDELTAQNVYTGILNSSRDYCYIMTPYLIIDTDFQNALILCAKQGVDVRLVTPGIPDKRMVWNITRSYYRTLIEGGVKIYEYSPGFVHSKVFVSDDKAAAVGTVNLDYRSLYLHFENGTYLYGSKKVLDIKQDCLNTMALSHMVTAEETHYSFIREFILSVLRLFAPMM